MKKNKWFLNGGRGSGRSFRLLCETYENKISNLEKENADLKDEKKELLRDTVIYDNHLTYAKMLLGKFMKFYERTARECYSKEFQQLLADTERFLNREGK